MLEQGVGVCDGHCDGVRRGVCARRILALAGDVIWVVGRDHQRRVFLAATHCHGGLLGGGREPVDERVLRRARDARVAADIGRADDGRGDVGVVRWRITVGVFVGATFSGEREAGFWWQHRGCIADFSRGVRRADAARQSVRADVGWQRLWHSDVCAVLLCAVGGAFARAHAGAGAWAMG